MASKGPTKTQLAFIERVRKAGGVMVTHDPEHGKRHYTLLNGRGVSPRSVHAAVRNGLLAPNDDGLMPSQPQTYRVTS